MKNLKLIFLAAFILISASAVFAQTRVSGRVVEIVDGKTVAIELLNGRLLVAELQYIEVPEPGQPFSEVAKEHLRSLTLDKKVDFKARGLMPTRTVGQLLLKGVDISQQMIRDGAAWYAVLEKSSQDAAESKIYQSNEAQAKSEQLGVWSIANLKPSWEIRAEVAAKRKQQTELAEKSFQTTYKPAPKRPVAAKRPAPSKSGFEMWADVSDYAAEQPTGVGGLVLNYDANARTGFVSTSRAVIDLSAKNFNHRIDLRMAYLYHDGEKGRESIYMVGVLSESNEWKFLTANNLTVVADNQKIVLGKARRLFRQSPTAVQELLLYKINRTAIAKIARTKNLEIKLGTYSGKVSGKLLDMLKNLLQAAE